MKLNLCCFSKRVVNVQPNISSQCTAYQSNSLTYSHGLCINLEILIQKKDTYTGKEELNREDSNDFIKKWAPKLLGFVFHLNTERKKKGLYISGPHP